MSAIYPLYYAQTVVFMLLSCMFLLMAASTSLAQMFIPASQRQAHHLPILRMTALAALLQILHQLDPYAVLGIYSTALAHFFQYQVTSLMLYDFAYCLHHSFASLYHVTKSSVPRSLPYLVWTCPILHHLTRTALSCIEFSINLDTADTAFLSKLVIVRTVSYNITSGVFILLSGVLVLQLAVTSRSCIRNLEQMEKRESAASEAATLAAKNSVTHSTSNIEGPSSITNTSQMIKPLPHPICATDIHSRIESIRRTTRQVMLGTLGITLVIMASFAFNATKLNDIAAHNLSRAEFVIADASAFGWKGFLVHLSQMIHLALFTRYTWRSPMIWICSPYSIMTTLSFGREFAVAQAARRARVAQAKICPGSPNSEEHGSIPRMHQPLVVTGYNSRTSSPQRTSPRLLTRHIIIVRAGAPIGNHPQRTSPKLQALHHTIFEEDLHSTIHVPAPPFNSAIGVATCLKQESFLPSINEQLTIDMLELRGEGSITRGSEPKWTEHSHNDLNMPTSVAS